MTGTTEHHGGPQQWRDLWLHTNPIWVVPVR
jgi:hypothetical protein